MATTTDFEQLNQEKAVAELAIKIRAGMEYTLRVLDEQITTIDGSMKHANHGSISSGIRTEETNILKKIKALRDDLNTHHSEYLTIT